MDGTAFWIAGTFAAIFVGLGKAGMPISTALAVPTLSLVISPVTAAGILLPVYMASDVFGLIAYRKSFDKRVLRIMLVAMPIGVLVGYLTANIVSEALITIILGTIGAVFAMSMILRRPVEGPPKTPHWKPGLFWGSISGFTSFVSHSGSVPFQVYTLPLQMPKLVFAGTVTVSFAYVNFVKVLPYYLLGQLNIGSLKTAAILMVPAILAVFAGLYLVRKLPEKLFFRLIIWMLLFLSVKLLWDGLHGL